MKIESITIYNYKSIGTECTLQFEDKSTVLVGRSNVGKSNLLEAISFLFDWKGKLKKPEYCTWRQDWSPVNVCVKMIFIIENKDKDLLQEIDEDLNSRERIVIQKRGNGTYIIEFTPIRDEHGLIPPDWLDSYLKNIRSRLNRNIKSFRRYTRSKGFPKEISVLYSPLVRIVKNKSKWHVMEDENAQKLFVQTILGYITEIRDSFDRLEVKDHRFIGVKMGLSRLLNDMNNITNKIVYDEIPKRKYTISELEDVLPSLVSLKGSGELKIEEDIPFYQIEAASTSDFMKQLIDLSGMDVNLILGTDMSIVDQQREKAEKKLTKILADYWSQEPIHVILRREYDADLPEEVTNKHRLYLDIEDSEGHRKSIKEQSPGFQWFLSFTVKHLIGKPQHKSIFLMIDEPGIHLSPDAQKDLLERFEHTEKSVQILYTTHSPFMLNKNFPYRIRLISKGKDSAGNDVRGTNIDNKPYHSKRGRAWEPIRTGIGLSSGASLFLAGRNLIVEGISDQILISSVIQSIQRFMDIKIDLNKVCICFAGNNNIVPMALYAKHETDNVAVVLDSDKSDEEKKLRNSGFPKSEIFVINKNVEVASKENCSDIESLFSTDYYQKMFKKAYKSIPNYKPPKGLPSTWKIISDFFKNNKDETTKWGRSKYYSEYFKRNKLGGFDKRLVAKTIAEDLMDADQKKVEDITELFMKFLKTVWLKMNWLEK